MKKRVRQQFGSVVFDKRIRTWNFLWWENGKRRSKAIGTLRQFPTKTSAWRAATALRHMLDSTGAASNTPNVRTLVEKYRAEKMPRRSDTRRSYEVWLRNHIIPKWGNCALSDVQARPVELWLESLTLAPKSKAHIRGLLSILWDFAMWRGDLPMQRNPMEIVKVKGATRRSRQPRSLAVDEFQRFCRHLQEPFATIALLSCCLGLRISECLGLKWCDVDWLNSTLRVERGIVSQRVDDVKTTESRKQMAIDPELLEVLKRWKQSTQFVAPEDWMFASPVQLGRLPWSYDQVWRMYQKAAGKAGIGGLGTHSLRHTYRTWLDAVGTPIGVQQRLMRHADIRTTMNIYGDAVTEDMLQANSKIVRLALPQS
jgi:integrase